MMHLEQNVLPFVSIENRNNFTSFPSFRWQVEKEHIKECWHENVTQCHGMFYSVADSDNAGNSR